MPGLPVLLMPYSQLVPQYLSYWYPVVNHYLSISHSNTQQSATVSVPDLLTRNCPLVRQYTTVPVPVLLISYSTQLSHYQSYWYATVHNCPSTSPTAQSTSAPVPTLLIWYSPPLPPYQSCSRLLLQYVLLITYNHILSQYQSYGYPTVDYYPIINPMILYCPSLPQYQSYWYDTLPESTLLIRYSQILS